MEGCHQKRGPHGESNFELKPNAEPKTIKPFNLVGERRAAMIELIKNLESEGKIEPGVSAWTSPAFPVPKKKRRVQTCDCL